MPYKGDGHQFSVRIPRETWRAIEALFAARKQSHLSKNDKVLTLLNERLGDFEKVESRMREQEIASETQYMTRKQSSENPKETKKETGG